MMDMLVVVPTYPIATALLAGFLIPVLLVLFAHGRFRLPRLGGRLRTVLLFDLGLWLLTLPLGGGFTAADVVTGSLVLAIAAMAFYIVWGQMAWGFTLSLLMALAERGEPLSAEEWVRAQCGGSRRDFARNRLLLLLKSGLAKEEAAVVTLTGKGRQVATMVALADFVFGTKRTAR